MSVSTIPVHGFDKLKGLLRESEGERLAWLAAQVPADQAIVEIGSYMGMSTVCLAQGSIGARVHAVDPWNLGGQRHASKYAANAVFRAFGRQTRGYEITAHRGYSVDVASSWDGPPVGLLFIDGEHTYSAVMADIDAWWGHLAPGACVAFHDYDDKFPGVIEAVSEWTSGLNLEMELIDRVSSVRLP